MAVPDEGSSHAEACAASSPQGKAMVVDLDLEDYVHKLEMQLSMKSTMLEEALRLHSSFQARLHALEEGITWKDGQLAVLMQQSAEAWQRASEASRDRTAWRERSERLEEENCVLRDELMQSADTNEQLRQLLEVLEAKRDRERDISPGGGEFRRVR
ncbi:unnamed protein product, partial [Polarella glacialis]